ncbi:unnamed protein product [marine sediment metagenome]|uniref:Glycosyltransferase 2-like domain-containing protein n=1 Tax=marine sediment metagenome TaxID=412755 RepID=X0RRM2_9ZZZZ
MTIDRQPVSGCTIIRDAVKGAFCLFESMATMLPIVDDMHVMDMGSTDGTLEILHKIADANKRIHIHTKEYEWVNPITLANASNDVIDCGAHDNVLFWQADEIWHENLLQIMAKRFEEGVFNMTFWRYQLRDNFQKVHWLPHRVHRVNDRRNGMFRFIGDGMNTEKIIDAKACTKHTETWPQRVDVNPVDVPWDCMILDVCSLGAFRDNLVARRKLHHPLWGESVFTIEGAHPDAWLQKAMVNPDWTKEFTPFDIPHIMRWHVGKTTYDVRSDLIRALMEDDTLELLGL